MLTWPDTIIFFRIAAWAGIGLTALALFAWWRLREVIRRYRSIRVELDSLARRRDESSGARKAALGVVIERCTKAYRDPFPKAGNIININLVELVREVARCYHPEVEHPEFAVRCGRLLWASRRMSERTAELLSSPGFGRLHDLRLRNIKMFYHWYLKLHRSAVVRTVVRWNTASKWVLRSRLIIFPDPFSWLAFLSHKLILMSLLRCIFTDLFLAVGILAVECYDEEDPKAGSEDAAEPEVSGFRWFQRNEEGYPDPRIRDIRRSLPGMTDSLNLAQWGLRWRRAVERAALVFASDQFPSARNPIEEASFGALVERLSAWLLEFSRIERKSAVHAILGVRLGKLLGFRELAEGDAAVLLGRTFRSLKDIYSGIRVPVKAARWLTKGSAGRIAMEAGWTFAGRMVASYFFKYGFDLACREIDTLYRKSRSG
ncbi:MAG: hypothetical protein R6U13_01005 [Desulfatiglandaceae bacterium]